MPDAQGRRIAGGTRALVRPVVRRTGQRGSFLQSSSESDGGGRGASAGLRSPIESERSAYFCYTEPSCTTGRLHVARRLFLPDRESDFEGLSRALPEHVAGYVVVAGEPAGDDGRADVRFHQGI